MGDVLEEIELLQKPCHYCKCVKPAVKASDVVKGKTTIFYFSPKRNACNQDYCTTALLKSFAVDVNGSLQEDSSSSGEDNEQEESKQMDGLEVVIVSWVDNEKDREKYFNDSYGDWYYLFFEDKPDSQAHRLMQKFGVVDTPKLVVVKSDGHVLDVDAQKELEDTKKSGMRAVVDFLALVT